MMSDDISRGLLAYGQRRGCIYTGYLGLILRIPLYYSNIRHLLANIPQSGIFFKQINVQCYTSFAIFFRDSLCIKICVWGLGGAHARKPTEIHKLMNYQNQITFEQFIYKLNNYQTKLNVTLHATLIMIFIPCVFVNHLLI